MKPSGTRGRSYRKPYKVVGQSKNHDELMILERTAKEMILLMRKNNPLYADARKKKTSSHSPQTNTSKELIKIDQVRDAHRGGISQS